MKKLLVTQLRIGMYIVDTGLSWTDHPLLYSREGFIESRDHIDEIMRQGFREAFVDYTRSKPDALKGLPPEDDLVRDVRPAVGEREQSVSLDSLQEDMLEAESIYSNSLAVVRQIVNDARLGTSPDMNAAEAMVENVMDSVFKNPDAMVSLAKLRTYDEYTYTHCINVSVLAVAMGRHLKLKRGMVRLLGLAGLFHDMGKSRVPSAILNKPGRLTDREFEIMKNHPDEGYRMLSSVKGVHEQVLLGALQHHEKFNGVGYPRGLKGREISVAARLLALADIYDALTSKRVYKDAMPLNKALRIMYSMRGKDFGPGEVERFVRCLGIYPVGSFVRLTDGRYGMVLKANPEHALKPALLMVVDEKGRKQGDPEVLDLSLDQTEEGLSIEATADPAPFAVDPVAYLVGPKRNR